MKSTQVFICSAMLFFTIAVFGQTNADWSARFDRDLNKLVTWGGSTNNIQFGLRICPVGRNIEDKLYVSTYLCTTNTASIYGLWELSEGHRLEMSLRTKDGREVKMTSKGAALCGRPPMNLRPHGRIIVLDPQAPENYDQQFCLSECFRVKEAGSYVFTAKPNLYSLTSSGSFVRLDIPAVRVEVVLPDWEIEDNN